MSYNVKVNGKVLPELYSEQDIRGYASAWREYKADVQVALSGTHLFMSLAKFLGEPEAPSAPPQFPPSGPLPPPAYTPPPSGYLPPPRPAYTPPPSFGGPGYSPGPPPGNLKSGMAVTGMIFGILGICGFLTCGLTSILAIPGVILSFMANSRAASQPRVYGGKNMAITGIVLNLFAILVIPFFAAIAVPNLLAARRSANQASAVQTLRNIHSAQSVYESGIGMGQYAASLKELEKVQLLQSNVIQLDRVPRQGYRIVRFEAIPRTSTQAAHYFVVIAPVQDTGIGRSGNFSFYIDDSGVLRQSRNSNELADENCPAYGNASNQYE